MKKLNQKNPLEGKECNYPGCKSKAESWMSLPFLTKMESGELKQNLNKMQGTVPFCKYHFYIMGSGHWGITNGPGSTPLLSGPFKIVDLIESVMAARETTKMAQPKNKEELLKHAKSKKTKQTKN